MGRGAGSACLPLQPASHSYNDAVEWRAQLVAHGRHEALLVLHKVAQLIDDLVWVVGVVGVIGVVGVVV